jgi:hypothetical protein
METSSCSGNNKYLRTLADFEFAFSFSTDLYVIDLKFLTCQKAQFQKLEAK